MRKINRVFGFLSLVLASFLVTNHYCANSVSAYTASITTANSITLDIAPAGDGTSIHSESINIQSDCRAGYNLTIATPEGSSLYKDGSTSNSATFTSVDGTSALGSSNNTNKWGYTLTSNPTSSTVFSPLSTTASVLKTPSQTASPSADIDDTFSINYGAKVDNTITPGNYQMANNGTIVYFLTMDTTCTQYTISFNPNGGTVSGGGNNPEQYIQIGEPTKLTSSAQLTAPTGGSYTDADNNIITGDPDKLWTFWGWNTQADGTGDWYKDKESVQDLANAGTTITLYAQWKQATLADMISGTPIATEKVIDHDLMQDMKPEVCWNSSITTAVDAPAATLKDYRGKVTAGESPESAEQYTVSKLADGLCWMTANLNLGRSGTDGPNGNGTITLTSDDTDLAANTTFTLPVSTTTSSTSTTAARIRVTNTSGNNDNGTYYSWPAAIASTATYTTANVIVTSSVCPKNWDLPTNDQYTNLRTKAAYTSSNTTTSAPSSFLTNGGFTNGATFNQTSYSHFWTSRTAGTYAYGSRVNASSISVSSSSGTTYGGNKYYEKNLRCVASQGTATINYDGNGTTEYPVTGSVDSQTNVEIASTNIQQGSGFTRTDWVFNNWNTAPDGSGITIAAGASLAVLGFKPGDTITLYAQWNPQYTITYVNNCKSWASSDANCTDSISTTTSEQKINLNSSGNGSGTLGDRYMFTLAGQKIIGWTTNADGSGTEYLFSASYNVTGASTGAPSGITLYAHWVPVYTVQYDGNNSDNDSTGMGSIDATTGIKTVKHTNVAEGDTFDLFASNFKKAGYGFIGWSTDANAWNKLTDNDTTNDAKIWGPNEIITAPAYNGTPITTLYAIWAPAETSNGNPVYLQNWTGCSAMTATTYNSSTGKLTVAKDSITALTDERDGNVYAIAKLADGNCWMMENLRLADVHTESGNTVATILTTSNTNIDINNSTLPITNIYNADPLQATTSNSLSPSSSEAYNASSAPYGWCLNASTVTCFNKSLLNAINTTTEITPSQTQSVTSPNAHTNFNDSIYSYGNYYNWYSATAGYGTYDRTTSEPTAGDLCPTNWRLPYGGKGTSGANIGNTKGGFYYLASRMSATSSNQVNANKFRMFPNNFVYSGSGRNTINNRGYNGIYWSSSAQDSGNAYYLSLSSSPQLLPGNYATEKIDGKTVRCVVSPAS